MKIAIFGGSFDPPHLGHVQIVQYLLTQNQFDKVWIFPNFNHPFKNSSASFEHRLKMCQLAFKALGKQVDICEDEKKLSGYTIDLLQYLKTKFPKFSLTFVLGSDLKDQIKSWKESEKINQLCKLLFLARASHEASPFIDISSSELREKIKADQDISRWVPQEIINYIKTFKLYQDKS